MQFTGFFEIRTYLGSSYIWEDFTSRLISFTEISESPRDKLTGENSASTFSIVVDNKDSFWFAPEKATLQGQRLNDGSDPYTKTLRYRRVRIGVYIQTGANKVKQPWITGRIKTFTANIDEGTVTLECESLEAEAIETLLDVKSGVDTYGDYYGIRGHIIEHSGDFEDTQNSDGDPVYPIYKRKETYSDADDYTTAIEFHRSMRIDALLQRLREVLDIADETPVSETVLRKAYKISSTDQSLIRRRATDQVQVLDNTYFGDTNGDTSFLLLMADLDGNLCKLFEGPGTSANKFTYLSYYNYRTNTWTKFNVGTDKYTSEQYCDLPAKTDARLGWYNTYNKCFQWIGIHSTTSAKYLYTFDPTDLSIVKRQLRLRYSGVTYAISAVLCFSQTTTGNSGKGSIFVVAGTTTPGGSQTLWELDVSDGTPPSPDDWWSTFILGPLADPSFGRGDQARNPGRETYSEWGASNYVITPASCYDTLGTCGTAGSGLIIAVDRTAASLGYTALWVDLYGAVAAAGIGYLIWGDITAKVDKMSKTQRPVTMTDPMSNHVVILPLQKATGDNYTLVRFPDSAWSTDNSSASGAVSGNGETKHAYFDENGGQGVLVPAAYEDLEEGDTQRYDRFYFWANKYYGANGPGKLQSTDGETLRAENTAIDKARYGDMMFGDYPNALVATGLAFTTGRDGTLIVVGGFYNSDEDPDTNYIFVYGWDIQWALPLLDVRDLSMSKLLSNLAQLTGYDWWFGPYGELNFIDRRPDAKRNEFTLSLITQITLDSPGYDFNEVINNVRIVPYYLTFQDNRFMSNGETEPFYRQQTPLKTFLKYINVLPTCTEHVKIKVQITGSSPDRYKIYEYDDVSNDWVEVDSGTTKSPGSDWADPSGKYSIPGVNWDITFTANVGDYWLFWTFEPLWGLEPLDANMNVYEAIDIDSEKKYGKGMLKIQDNRFITRKDADLVANRILRIAKDAHRIYEVQIPLSDNIPAIGDSVYFESKYFLIDLTQEWQVIGRTKLFGSSEKPDGVITLRLEEVL